MKLLAAALLFCVSFAFYADMREVSFYCVRPAKTAPVLDGKLDDPCWKEAQEFTSSYEYFKPNPGPGKTRKNKNSTAGARTFELRSRMEGKTDHEEQRFIVIKTVGSSEFHINRTAGDMNLLLRRVERKFLNP